MKKYFLLLITFITPITLLAAENTLSDKSLPKILSTCGANPGKCGFTELIQVVNALLEWAMVGLASTATIMFVYAGFLYMSAQGDTNQVKRAHGIFRVVLIGFIIILLAYLLIQQFLKAFGSNQNIQNLLDNQANSSKNSVSVIDSKNSGKNDTPGSVIESQANNGLSKPNNGLQANNKIDIKKQFGLENLSDESVKKIEDKIEWLKQRAKGEAGWMKGEDHVSIVVTSDGKVQFFEDFIGIGGGAVNTTSRDNFLSKNPNSKIIDLHTHDYDSVKNALLMCEAEGVNKCNPDNPPSYTDFTKIVFHGTNNTQYYAVEQDGDFWKYQVVPNSKLDQIEDLVEIEEKAKNLALKRIQATTYNEAQVATKNYIDYLKSVGAEMVKIPVGQ